MKTRVSLKYFVNDCWYQQKPKQTKNKRTNKETKTKQKKTK